MSAEVGFWRNVALIAFAHIALLIAILHWRSASISPRAQPIMWMTSSQDQSTPPISTSIAAPQPSATPIESASATDALEKVQEGKSLPSLAKSEIELSVETPTATPAPKPSSKPRAEAAPAHSKATAKPTPKPSVKATKAKSSPTSSSPASHKSRSNRSVPALINKEKTAGKSVSARQTETGGNSGDAGVAAGNNAADLNWYGDMLHDRFYREWVQPTTVVAAGAKLSALVKIRIEKDGRISDFKIIRSSGNIVVDESITSLGKRVNRVDGLPTGLGKRDHYDVSINFELNPAQ